MYNISPRARELFRARHVSLEPKSADTRSKADFIRGSVISCQVLRASPRHQSQPMDRDCSTLKSAAWQLEKKNAVLACKENVICEALKVSVQDFCSKCAASNTLNPQIKTKRSSNVTCHFA